MTIKPPDPYGLRRADLVGKFISNEIHKLKGDGCGCNEDCNTDPRTLFPCLCPCHYDPCTHPRVLGNGHCVICGEHGKGD